MGVCKIIDVHCLKSVQIRSLFRSFFSRIRTEYGEIKYGPEKTPHLDIFLGVVCKPAGCENQCHIVDLHESTKSIWKTKKQTNKQTNKTSKTHSDDVAVSKGLLVSSWIIAFTRLQTMLVLLNHTNSLLKIIGLPLHKTSANKNLYRWYNYSIRDHTLKRINWIKTLI